MKMTCRLRLSPALRLMVVGFVLWALLTATPAWGVEAGGSAAPRPTLSLEVVFMLVFLMVLVGLFFWEPVPLYVLALGIPVVLAAFEPLTGLSTGEAISGFASEATVTILCMFILSEGVNRSGIIQVLGDRLSGFAGDSETRQLAAVTGLSGPIAGIINNTPVVAIFIPMLSNLARRVKASPSKLMMPLSFASMMGGTLTLIGSSTNLLASDLSGRLLGRPIAFFEFTAVGAVILAAGTFYLVFLAPRLIPERIDPEEDLAEEYEMEDFLTELVLDEASGLLGKNVGELLDDFEMDLDLVRIVRGEEQFMEPLEAKTLREGDRLVVRTRRSNLLDLLDRDGIRLWTWTEDRISEEQLEAPVKGQTMLETVVPKGSFLEGQTLTDVNFVDRYDATVLAVRRGEELTHARMDQLEINAGDVLLLLATETTLSRLRQNRNFIVVEAIEPSEYRWEKTPLVLGILAGVVLLAALGVAPIALSALGGVLTMAATGCIEPNELHESVDWEVVFLLAGLIPLGMAMQRTGAAHYLARWVMRASEALPPLGVLTVFYLFTVVMTNLIHKNASVVVMIPIAVDAASSLGLAPFPFLITVMLAASTAFLTPVGNHTNLMVYGPGGYRFSDFFRVGAPLQLLLAVVTPVTVSLVWGLGG